MNNLEDTLKEITSHAMKVNKVALENITNIVPNTSIINNLAKQASDISKVVINNTDVLVENHLIETLKNISNPLIEAQKMWIDNVDLKTPLDGINIDFSYIEKNVKIGCEKMLKNGFYPYSKIDTSTCLSVVNENDSKKIEQILEESAEYYIKILKSDIIKTFSDYSEYLEELYILYDEKKYRLCILSLINILSQIFNESFEHKDFTEMNEIILRNYNLMNLSNDEYYQFMPYYIENKNELKKKHYRKYRNTLLCNCKDHNEKYRDIPYNRNAILHGYSKEFGNKINCLRWFSVLLNTNDIFKENQLKGGNK